MKKQPKRYRIESITEPFALVDVLFMATIAGAFYWGSYYLGTTLVLVGVGHVITRLTDKGYVEIEANERLRLRGHLIGSVPLTNILDVEVLPPVTHRESPMERILGLHTSRLRPSVIIHLKRRRVLASTSGIPLLVFPKTLRLRVSAERATEVVADIENSIQERPVSQ
jgi:hypothetical protein